MLETTEKEFLERFEWYQNAALIEPVRITNEDETQLVLISNSLYDHFHQLYRKEQRAFHISDISAEDMKIISESRMPPGFEHLNEEMEGDEPEDK